MGGVHIKPQICSLIDFRQIDLPGRQTAITLHALPILARRFQSPAMLDFDKRTSSRRLDSRAVPTLTRLPISLQIVCWELEGVPYTHKAGRRFQPRSAATTNVRNYPGGKSRRYYSISGPREAFAGICSARRGFLFARRQRRRRGYVNHRRSTGARLRVQSRAYEQYRLRSLQREMRLCVFSRRRLSAYLG